MSSPAFMPRNVSVSVEDTHHALGFEPPEGAVLDAKLPARGTLYEGKYGKKWKNAQVGIKIYKCDKETAEKIGSYDVLERLKTYQRHFNEISDDEEVIVKMTPIWTLRNLLTCFKEAMITNRIYNTEKNGVKGSDIVCKPYICTPIRRKKGWCFVFISQRAKGDTLEKLENFFIRTVKGVSRKHYTSVSSLACTKLWSLGFVHNDMHLGNAVYDPKTKVVKLIDLETAVEVESTVLDKYIRARSESREDCYVTFEKVMLAPAMEMLRHSESWLNEFSHKDEFGDRMIYNTDCQFVAYIEL